MSGSSSAPYSPKCLELEFCEVRRYGVLGNSRGASHPVGLSSVPTVLREGPYRFFFWSNEFYSDERTEPPHIHVESERGRTLAKFWLEEPTGCAKSRGFAAHELTRIQSLVQQHRTELLRAWNAHFRGQ
jgi:hypothetical protein